MLLGSSRVSARSARWLGENKGPKLWVLYICARSSGLQYIGASRSPIGVFALAAKSGSGLFPTPVLMSLL